MKSITLPSPAEMAFGLLACLVKLWETLLRVDGIEIEHRVLINQAAFD